MCIRDRNLTTQINFCHCTFTFYHCTFCVSLHVKICPALPSPPLRSRAPSLRLGGLGERSSSPSGSGRSPAAKRFLVHFQPIRRHFLQTFSCSLSFVKLLFHVAGDVKYPLRNLTTQINFCHCTFTFYHCTFCVSLHVKICPVQCGLRLYANWTNSFAAVCKRPSTPGCSYIALVSWTEEWQLSLAILHVDKCFATTVICKWVTTTSSYGRPA